MTKNELQRAADAVRWWHNGIDLGQGVITQGESHLNYTILPFLDLPDDLSGKTVIDVGAWDGYMSFWCEERGADVVAVDSKAWDVSLAGTSMFPHHNTHRRGFDLAHKARQSKVRPIVSEVYDLTPDSTGRFDVVLLLGVLYHLRHPLLAIERMSELTTDLLVVESAVLPFSEERTIAKFLPHDELNRDPSNWWLPSVECVTSMLHDVGFDDVKWRPTVGERAIFHARKGGA